MWHHHKRRHLNMSDTGSVPWQTAFAVQRRKQFYWISQLFIHESTALRLNSHQGMRTELCHTGAMVFEELNVLINISFLSSIR